jgi:hypothetical protein
VIDLWFLSLYPLRRIIILHISILLMVFIIGFIMKDIHDPSGLVSFSTQKDHMVELTSFVRFLAVKAFILFHLMDDQEMSMKPMIGYIGRFKYNRSKWIVHIIMVTYVSFLFVIFLEMISFYFTGYAFFTIDQIIHFFLDSMILMVVYLLFIHDKHKFYLLLTAFVIIIVHMLITDQNKAMLYYLLPIAHPIYDTYLLAWIYKIWYIVTGSLLYLLKSSYVPIYL